MTFPEELRSYHPIEAREAFMRTLEEAGFSDAVATFAKAHPPMAFRLAAAASTSASYEDHVRQFARRWGLDAPWFREVIHDRAWAASGGRPTRHYLHTLPSPFARLELILGAAAGRSPDSRDGLSGWALWLNTPRLMIRRRLLDDAVSVHQALIESRGDMPVELIMFATLRFATLDGRHIAETRADRSLPAGVRAQLIRRTVGTLFDEMWRDTVQPTRLIHGASPRNRSLNAPERNARAVVAHGFARTRRRSGESMVSATMRLMDEFWPGSVDSVDDDTIQKSLVNFGRMLKDPDPSIPAA